MIDGTALPGWTKFFVFVSAIPNSELSVNL